MSKINCVKIEGNPMSGKTLLAYKIAHLLNKTETAIIKQLIPGYAEFIAKFKNPYVPFSVKVIETPDEINNGDIVICDEIDNVVVTEASNKNATIIWIEQHQAKHR